MYEVQLLLAIAKANASADARAASKQSRASFGAWLKSTVSKGMGAAHTTYYEGPASRAP